MAHWCEHGKRRGKTHAKCHRCGKRGHVKRDCREEFSDDSSSSTEDKRKAVSFVANRSKRTGKLVFKLDSGASDHLVNDRRVFAHFRKLKQPVVINVAKEGATLKARHAGEIRGDSNRRRKLHMKDVLFVPELRDNLMSVQKLTKAGIDVVFSKSVAILKFGGEVIATGHLRGGLYEVAVDVDLRSCGQPDGIKAWRAKDSVTDHVTTRERKCCTYQAIAAHEQEGENRFKILEEEMQRSTFAQARRGRFKQKGWRSS